MTEKQKVAIVNLITGTRFLGTFFLPVIVSLLGPLGNAFYIGTLWLTDLLDGYLARRWEVSTIFGASFDALCDKILGIATLIYLYSFYPMVLISIISELAIVYTNWHYGSKGSDVKTSIIGKIKTGIFDFSIVLAILSTISLASSLAYVIPALIGITTAFQLTTLGFYIIKNKKYLKEHTPKNNVSRLGFFEKIKEIIRLLKDKKLYSPTYYKEHKDEPLLDKLYEIDEPKIKLQRNSIQTKDETMIKQKGFSVDEKNYLKVKFNLLDKEIDIVEKNAIEDNVNFEDLVEWLSLRSNLTPEADIVFSKTYNQIKTKKNQKNHKIITKNHKNVDKS